MKTSHLHSSRLPLTLGGGVLTCVCCATKNATTRVEFRSRVADSICLFQSGGFAALINISQFFIIAQTGPVSSTVVGHVKTCTIVALGWMTSGRAIGDKSVLGVFVAIGGIIA